MNQAERQAERGVRQWIGECVDKSVAILNRAVAAGRAVSGEELKELDRLAGEIADAVDDLAQLTTVDDLRPLVAKLKKGDEHDEERKARVAREAKQLCENGGQRL